MKKYINEVVYIFKMNIIQTWKTKEIPVHYYKFILNLRDNNTNCNFIFLLTNPLLYLLKNTSQNIMKRL
jgi:hypothetical protein